MEIYTPENLLFSPYGRILYPQGEIRMVCFEPHTSEMKTMATLTPTKRKTKGGPRKMLTWQEKLACVDVDVCRKFVATSCCDCKENCFERIRQQKDKGAQMVLNLREARTMGMRIPCKLCSICQNDNKSSITVFVKNFLTPGVTIASS